MSHAPCSRLVPGCWHRYSLLSLALYMQAQSCSRPGTAWPFVPPTRCPSSSSSDHRNSEAHSIDSSASRWTSAPKAWSSSAYGDDEVAGQGCSHISLLGRLGGLLSKDVSATDVVASVVSPVGGLGIVETDDVTAHAEHHTLVAGSVHAGR